MLGTVMVRLFYRQLVYRVRTTAGQDSRGRELLQTNPESQVPNLEMGLRCQDQLYVRGVPG